MIDIFAIALTHGLLALAAWRLVLRDDLDVDPGEDDAAHTKREKRIMRVHSARD